MQNFFQDTLDLTNVSIPVTVSLLRSWHDLLNSQNDWQLLLAQQHHDNINSSLSQSEQECSIARLKSVLALCNFFQTEVGSGRSDRKCRVFKLKSKEIIPDEDQ